MLDTFKHKGLRKRLVESVAKKGITDERVLEAMLEVPRHWFVTSDFQHAAYEDQALPIKAGQTISQPYTVAYQTQLLDVAPKTKVLEIGTGSGYQAAILCAMGARLFTVELENSLHKSAKEKLAELGYEPKMLCGDGSQGWRQFAPFQRILVTAASPGIPEPLKKQLEVGGRMVIPSGDAKLQQMCVVKRLSRMEFEVEKRDHFRFVPLRGRFGFEG